MVPYDHCKSWHACHDEADSHLDDSIFPLNLRIVHPLIYSRDYPERYNIPRLVRGIDAVYPKPQTHTSNNARAGRSVFSRLFELKTRQMTWILTKAQS